MALENFAQCVILMPKLVRLGRNKATWKKRERQRTWRNNKVRAHCRPFRRVLPRVCARIFTRVDRATGVDPLIF